MNAESVLLTVMVIGFCGGFILFSRRARQSIPLKNGCSLKLSRRP